MADLGPILNAKWLTLFDPLEMLSYIHVDDCADVLIGAYPTAAWFFWFS